jgi:hypothetical protein
MALDKPPRPSTEEAQKENKTFELKYFLVRKCGLPSDAHITIEFASYKITQIRISHHGVISLFRITPDSITLFETDSLNDGNVSKKEEDMHNERLVMITDYFESNPSDRLEVD